MGSQGSKKAPSLSKQSKQQGKQASKKTMSSSSSSASSASACLTAAAISVADRVKGALYGLMIADALASPSHWFYGGNRQVRSIYGGAIEGYVKPSLHLPGSIMSKSSTGGGGRGSNKGDIIGSVIFHGKKEFYAPGADYHYHCHLQAGENTLEGQLVRRIMINQVANDGFDANAIQEDYVRYMTTEGTHNDTYCGTSHRMFFANWIKQKKSGKPIDLKKCPDNDGHNVDSVDAIVTAVPVALIDDQDEQCTKNVRDIVGVYRNSNIGRRYAVVFAAMLRDVVANGTPVADAVQQGASSMLNIDVAKSARGGDPMTACYLDSSFPAMLVMAYKYSGSFREGVLANANRGGENVGSGALLGALLGAQVGFSNLDKDLVDGLVQGKEIESEIDAFIEKSLLVKSLSTGKL